MSNMIIVGAQWGDEGKGKIVDALVSNKTDAVVRFQGGCNAGHTIKAGKSIFKLHLLPSGIIHPDVLSVLSSGVVIDPQQLIAEIETLKLDGFKINLLISDRAHVTTPYHKEIDRAEEKRRGGNAIGTTGRGIGPTYTAKAARMGITMGDLIDPVKLDKKLQIHAEYYNPLLRDFYHYSDAEMNAFLDAGASIWDMINMYQEYGKYLKEYVGDALTKVNELVNNYPTEVIFEGAQGSLLDVNDGTYPYVTSSNTAAGAALVGTGLGVRNIQKVMGVYKAYCTRVGAGPFVTEEFGEIGEKLQTIGHEFGTTTGRKRRCGWFDLVAAKHTHKMNGFTHLAITKLDVLDTFEEIKVCTAYQYGDQVLREFPSDADVLAECKPIYKTLPGWKKDTSNCTSVKDLPYEAKFYVDFLAYALHSEVSIVSVGPDRDQTIFFRKY